MKIQWLTTWSDVWSDTFQQKWMELLTADTDSHVFSHPALAKAWVECYLPLRDIRPCFLLLECEYGTLLWPLIYWHRNWKNAFQRLLIPLGYSDFDYCDPIMTGNGDRFSLVKEAISQISQLHGFDQISLDGFRFPYHDKMTFVEPCPFIDLNSYQTADEFVGRMKSKMRYNIQKRQNTLSEQYGPLTYKIFSKNDWAQIQQELPVMLDFHTKRWPNAYKAPRYHELLLKHGLEAGLVHFSHLAGKNGVISWRVGFIFKDKFYSYMPTLNDNYLAYSPGKLHLLFCIEEAIRLGLKQYDQLRGAELYKSEWTDQFISLWRYKQSSPSLRSQLCNLCADRLKIVLKSILKNQ